jgi:hypothetical protein
MLRDSLLVGVVGPILALLSTFAACAAPDDKSAVGQSAEVTADAPDASAPSPGAIDWPTPAGWANETDAFPLFFAPDLPYAGVAELRFTPNCFDPTSPNYFSYSFAWVLDGDSPSNATALDQALETYYRGLAKTFDAAHFDPTAHQASIYSRSGWFVGDMKTVDPFNASRPLDLYVRGNRTFCNGRSVVIFTVTPHGSAAATSQMLQNEVASLHCAASSGT